MAHPDFGDGRRPWTTAEVALWAEVLQAKGVLLHGVKAKLNAGDVATPAELDRLSEIFEPALESLMVAWKGG
jgi:hypothetical protein